MLTYLHLNHTGLLTPMDSIKEVLTDLWKTVFPDVDVESLIENQTFNSQLEWGLCKYIQTGHQTVTVEDFKVQFPDLNVEPQQEAEQQPVEQPVEQQEQQPVEQKNRVRVVCCLNYHTI